MIGTVAGGAIGYQSGSKAVDKDYVQMAISNLANKQTSPELRQWSVQILDQLAPVPLSKKLKDELSIGPIVKLISPHITIPENISEPCPDLVGMNQSKKFDVSDIDAHNKLFGEFVEGYAVCRAKHEGMVRWVKQVQRLLDDANKTVQVK